MLRTVLAGLKRLFNAARRQLYPFLPLRIVLVARDPQGEKVQRIADRMSFFALPWAKGAELTVRRQVHWWDLLLTRAIVVADQSCVPSLYYKISDGVFNADYERNGVDGWDLCAISQSLAGLPNRSRTGQSRRRLQQALEGITSRPRNRVYALGTGPSLEAALQQDFSDGYVIVCNTIVRDGELWHHLKPNLIAAGDAIYHFGHTAFARAFRADLKRRLLESGGNTFFVYPELFDAIVQREFAEVEELLVPVPFGKHKDIDVDLLERFELPALGNVLNILLLPLACTLSRSVWLWGFDGRAPTDKLFWSNSKKHSYPELMDELLKEHPAFFERFVPKNKESAYVKAVHGDELDERLKVAESRGYQFVMMHFSWTETLNKRLRIPGGMPSVSPGVREPASGG